MGNGTYHDENNPEGHALWKCETSIAKTAVHWTPEGERKMGTIEKAAKERLEWKSLDVTL